MKKRLILLNLTILSLIPLFLSSAQSQNCATGDTRSTNYIQRDHDRRCEGIQPIEINGSFSLISLSIGRIATSGDSLKLVIPKTGNQEPKVRVRSLQKNYQLDPLTLRFNSSRYQYQFQWSNYVINKAAIDIQSLRAIAFINDGKLIYLPIIFSSAKQYDIVLFSDVRTKIIAVCAWVRYRKTLA